MTDWKKKLKSKAITINTNLNIDANIYLNLFIYANDLLPHWLTD